MLIDYNLEKINQFLFNFYNITGLTVSIWDTEMNQLSFQPDVMPDFCRLIKSSASGNHKCLLSDIKICTKCKHTLSATPHRCHAGLTDTALPIIFEDKLFGYIMFGQVRGKQDVALRPDDLKQLADEFSLLANDLYEAYNKLPTFDLDKIESAANILTFAAASLFDTGSIRYTVHELISKIDEYINTFINQPISVQDICSQFYVSKTRLYSIWKNNFGVTIGQYILDKRMKKAKKLIITSTQKINKICVDVGIPDYNYFTKIFKKYYGVPPKEYRKVHTDGK